MAATAEDSFGGAAGDLVGVAWSLCDRDELESHDGVVRGEGELELGSLFVEFADALDDLGDVGTLGPGRDLAEGEFVLARDFGDGVG